jgi:hypothetical protein
MRGTGVSTIVGIIRGHILPVVEAHHQPERERLRVYEEIVLLHQKESDADFVSRMCFQCRTPFIVNHDASYAYQRPPFDLSASKVCGAIHNVCFADEDTEQCLYNEPCMALLWCGRSWCTEKTTSHCFYCSKTLCPHDTYKCGEERCINPTLPDTPCSKKMCGDCAIGCEGCDGLAYFCRDHVLAHDFLCRDHCCVERIKGCSNCIFLWNDEERPCSLCNAFVKAGDMVVCPELESACYPNENLGRKVCASCASTAHC